MAKESTHQSSTSPREIRPHKGPQELFHRSSAFEVLFGGAAGPGKSFALVLEAMRQIGKPGYSAILFRRTFPQLEGPGGLIPISRELYQGRGIYRHDRHTWDFPGPSSIGFAHIAGREDQYNYQGHEYQYIGFDELSQFEEEQYRYLFSRVRSKVELGLRGYIRAASNPGAAWVRKRWGAWLDKRHPRPAKPGEIRWYAADGEGERETTGKDPVALSRTFIPASWRDNPSLDQGEYLRALNALPFVQRMRLKEGDWDIEAGAGKVINRLWIKIVKEMPPVMYRVRFWDFAATEKKIGRGKTNDPDFTATCFMGWLDGAVYISIKRAQLSWREVRAWVRKCAQEDHPETEIGIEQEPGSSGKAIGWEIITELGLLNRVAHSIPPKGDKVARASIWGAQAEAGNIHLIDSSETDTILSEFHAFPDPKWHDDMVDAVSGAWAMIAAKVDGGSFELLE